MKELAKELNQLSVADRQRVFDDIHGVSELSKETPELFNHSLGGLNAALSRARTRPNAAAFNHAVSENTAFVFRRNFLLQFLRCENFDVEKAAIKMVDFFEVKAELFGFDKLSRDITLKDFSKTDLKFIKTGVVQLLPTRDQAGRVVMVVMVGFLDEKLRCELSFFRTLYYMVMVALKDEETQRKGLIVIAYYLKYEGAYFFSLKKLSKLIYNGLPGHCKCRHMCYSNTIHSNMFLALGKLISKHMRLRTRLHLGTYLECNYSLMTFGIPMADFPVIEEFEGGEKGTLKLKAHRHQKWLSSRNRIESENGCTGIIIPSNVDILFGRGKPMRQHPGNMSLGLLIEASIAHYTKLRKGEKTAMAQTIVNGMKGRSVRFLKQDDNGLWFQVADDMAREKVSNTFRNVLASKRDAGDDGIHDAHSKRDAEDSKDTTSSNSSRKRAHQ